MANHKKTNSIKAKPGDFKPKKKADQRILRISCVKKTTLASPSALFFQTRNKETPISINKIIQTGEKIQSGGAKNGFLRFLYQPSIAGIIKTAPTSPANWQTTILIINFVIVMALPFLFFVLLFKILFCICLLL